MAGLLSLSEWANKCIFPLFPLYQDLSTDFINLLIGDSFFDSQKCTILQPSPGRTKPTAEQPGPWLSSLAKYSTGRDPFTTVVCQGSTVSQGLLPSIAPGPFDMQMCAGILHICLGSIQSCDLAGKKENVNVNWRNGCSGGARQGRTADHGWEQLAQSRWRLQKQHCSPQLPPLIGRHFRGVDTIGSSECDPLPKSHLRELCPS